MAVNRCLKPDIFRLIESRKAGNHFSRFNNKRNIPQQFCSCECKFYWICKTCMTTYILPEFEEISIHQSSSWPPIFFSDLTFD